MVQANRAPSRGRPARAFHFSNDPHLVVERADGAASLAGPRNRKGDRRFRSGRTLDPRIVADVQLEHGHIRIANALFRAVMLAKLSGSARRVLLECLSRQYGWARPKDAPRPFAAAPASVGKAIGCARETASRALSALVRQRVLRAVGDHAYLIEKDFDRWVCGFHGNPDHVHWTPAGDRDQTVTQRDEMITPPCDETVTPSVIKRSHPRDQTVTPAPART